MVRCTPVEDWAETFAYYLHIRDCMDTAAAFGFAPVDAALDRRIRGPSAFMVIIEMWLPLVWGLNMMNRSMGEEDLHPSVLTPEVLGKLRFVHAAIEAFTAGAD